MSGHSKWATIRHKKGAQDAKRGRIFSKIIKEITIASRLGGGEMESNPRLRAAILKAKAANMPKDNVDRAIKKGTGEVGGADYVELTYEGYGPGGVAILVDTLTDNRNRTAADIRSILSKHGGNLGESGCVSYLFTRKGMIGYDAHTYTEDQIIDVALEAGAADVSASEDSIEVSTTPESFEQVLEAMGAAGFTHSYAQISKVPEATVALDAEKVRKALKLIDLLEEHDDVQEVASNIEVPEDYEEE